MVGPQLEHCLPKISPASGGAARQLCLGRRQLILSAAPVLLIFATALLSYRLGTGWPSTRIPIGLTQDWAHEQLQEDWILGAGKQRDFIAGPLTYINDSDVAHQLGCPVHECGCFFQFREQHKALLSTPAQACQTRYKPLSADWGRPWCICKVQEPDWLRAHFPQPWKQIDQALVLGMVTGPNPTHQLHITFFWIWLWLVRIAKLKAGQVSLLVDCNEPMWCMGSYGIGLAKALMSDPIWLPLTEEPIVIGRIKFGLGGGFPYTLWEMQPFRSPLADYSGMTAAVKAHYNIKEAGFLQPLQIVISQRPASSPTSQRVLRNTGDLVASLEQRGFQVQAVDFGKLSFKEQLETVQGATTLVGITGSDLVTAVFLPQGGAVVEIFPSITGHQVINVEVHNFVRLASITYHKWHSPVDADLLYTEAGELMGDTLSRQIGQVDVDVPGGTAAIEAAALQAAMLQTDRVGEIWDSQLPVNASMYPAPSLGEAIEYKRQKAEKAQLEAKQAARAQQQAAKKEERARSKAARGELAKGARENGRQSTRRHAGAMSVRLHNISRLLV